MASKQDFPNPEKLTKEAREATADALDALAQWRDEMAKANDRYSEKVFDQMAKATKSMGWPDHLIDATRDHLQNASKMQLEMMDKVMDAWKGQIENSQPGMGMPAEFVEQMQKFMPPGMSGMPGMPNMGDMGGMNNMAMAPFQFWMQGAEMWQRNMATAMSMWTQGPQAWQDMMDPKKRK